MKRIPYLLFCIFFLFFFTDVLFAQDSDIKKINSRTGYVWPQEPEVQENLKKWMGLKFGVMFHWGIYSVPGITESWRICNEDWMPRDTTMTYQEYKDWYWSLADQFMPQDFDPEQWVEVMSEAGMKYMVFTTKHHDGFCMYDTQYTDYSITKHAFANDPRCDVWQHVQEAFKKKDFMIGAYFSKPDWHSQYFWWDVYATKDRYPSYNIEKYPWRWQQFKNYTYNQIEELVSNYGKLDILWLDGGWVRSSIGYDIDMEKIVEMARTHQPSLLVVDRIANTIYENYKTPEQTIPEEPLNYPWESCVTLSNMWSYGKRVSWKSSEEIINMLVKTVAMGGNLLLGVGPTPEGVIQPEVVERLKVVGEWLRKNGKAIYSTEMAEIYNDGNVWFTSSPDSCQLYATYVVNKGDTLPTEISWHGNIPRDTLSIRLLDTNEILPCHIIDQQVTVKLPQGLENHTFAMEIDIPTSNIEEIEEMPSLDYFIKKGERIIIHEKENPNQIHLYDIKGRRISFKLNHEVDGYSINLASLPKGIYLLTTHQHSIKISKQ